MVNLGNHFKSYEFQCPCGQCKELIIDCRLIEYLEALRLRVELPIRITSGYRCRGYQSTLREHNINTALGTSQHELGMAADISIEGMSGPQLELILRDMGIKAVGVADRWVHFDLRADKERRWTY